MSDGASSNEPGGHGTSKTTGHKGARGPRGDSDKGARESIITERGERRHESTTTKDRIGDKRDREALIRKS